MQAACRQMQQAASRQLVETVPLEDVPTEGWFPDASVSTAPGTLRYWDGRVWTANTRPEASQSFTHGSAA